MISMTYFSFISFFPHLVPLRDSECMCEYLNVSVNTHVCFSVCGSPRTNPPSPPRKPQKMWREICVDQDHKYSEVKVWSLSLSAACLFSEWNQLSSKETPLPLELTTCVTMTTPPLAHLSISPSFLLSIHPFFHLIKKAHFIPPKEMSYFHFQPIQSLRPQMSQTHPWYLWTIFQTQTHSVEDCKGLLLHKTGIQCSFVGLFYWRNKLYWASEWLKMSEE